MHTSINRIHFTIFSPHRSCPPPHKNAAANPSLPPPSAGTARRKRCLARGPRCSEPSGPRTSHRPPGGPGDSAGRVPVPGSDESTGFRFPGGRASFGGLQGRFPMAEIKAHTKHHPPKDWKGLKQCTISTTPPYKVGPQVFFS